MYYINLKKKIYNILKHYNISKSNYTANITFVGTDNFRYLKFFLIIIKMYQKKKLFKIQ